MYAASRPWTTDETALKKDQTVHSAARAPRMAWNAEKSVQSSAAAKLSGVLEKSWVKTDALPSKPLA